MKYVTEVIIPLFMGLVLCAVIFLMKGVLNFVIGLPIWIIGIAAAIVLTIMFILVNMLTSFFRYGREGFVFMEARKTGKLVICDVEIGTNNAEFILGEKDDPKSPLFKDEKSGVKVDPSMVSAYSEPMRFPGGLNIVGYAYKDILPQTNRNHLAFKAIVDYFEEWERRPEEIGTDGKPKLNPAKELSFLTPKEKIILISKPEHFLEADLKTMVGKYFKTRKEENDKIVYFRQFQKDGKWYEQTVQIPVLIHAVQMMKSDINKLPIATGYFSMNEAFKYNNVAYTAQHVSALKNLLTQLITEDLLGKMNLWTYGIILVAVIGVIGIVFYVLTGNVKIGG